MHRRLLIIALGGALLGCPSVHAPEDAATDATPPPSILGVWHGQRDTTEFTITLSGSEAGGALSIVEQQPFMHPGCLAVFRLPGVWTRSGDLTGAFTMRQDAGTMEVTACTDSSFDRSATAVPAAAQVDGSYELASNALTLHLGTTDLTLAH
jgi:hypothetical protein